MSRVNAALGVLVAGICGIATAYVTFQPEFQKQKSEQDGDFQEQHPTNEKAISQAIVSDMKEAKHQVAGEGDGKGFAWGIREAIWGPPAARQTSKTQQPDAKRTELQSRERQTKG